ncbi:hypothetical protein [Neoaquamicrobium sediminum]|uniref:hypothetical protein n=1 Tax=Neoaquamicrobium sediminum TaxID=1849104 RepID=UPI001563C4B8|nr:hypothetical protein [Mesorhizobium sediminum]NRC54188.1 hypothetical protein [Mesorhizobium sediminum]
MLKSFAIVAVMFGADGAGDAYVVDEGLTASECMAAIETYRVGSLIVTEGRGDDWTELRALRRGDTVQCELVIE